MSWSVEQSCNSIRFGISAGGQLVAFGNTERSEPRASLDEPGIEVSQRLGASKCSWSILSSAEPEAEIDPAGEGLYLLSRSDDFTGAAAIRFFSEPDLIGITIVLPPEAHQKTYMLLSRFAEDARRICLIQLGFFGFAVEGAETETPTTRQFLAGQPVLSKEITLTVYSIDD